jgi:hypothetical protein
MTTRVKNTNESVATESVATESVANESVATETVANETVANETEVTETEVTETEVTETEVTETEVTETEVTDFANEIEESKGLNQKEEYAQYKAQRAYEKRIIKLQEKSDARNGKENIQKVHGSLLEAIECIYKARNLSNVKPFAEVLGLTEIETLSGKAKKDAKAKAKQFVSFYAETDKGMLPLRRIQKVVGKYSDGKNIYRYAFVPQDMTKYDYLRDICANIAKYLCGQKYNNVKVDDITKVYFKSSTLYYVADNYRFICGEIEKILTVEEKKELAQKQLNETLKNIETETETETETKEVVK